MPEHLTICCWKWKPRPNYHSVFDASTVNTLRAMVDRHYPHPHDFVCITDDPEGIDGDIRIVKLWDDFKQLNGPNGVNCYPRLKAFSVEAADIIGPRFVSLDLDTVILKDLTSLWDRPHDFVIWGDTARGTPYNGSMFLLRAGTRRQVWETFDPVRSPQRAKQLRYIGSDQAWIGACLGPLEKKWTQTDGVFSFRNDLQTGKKPLPSWARIVMFHGRYDPWMPAIQQQHPWVKEHYRNGC